MISIILPVYNAKGFIDLTIKSIIDQTYKSWELIIVDDCSSDYTYEYLLERYLDHEQILIVKNDFNSGAGFTRNRGLELSKNKLIAFIDADDLWNERKLEIQIDFMRKYNYPIVHTSYTFIDEFDNKIPGSVVASRMVSLKSYMKNTEIGMSTAIIDRKLVGDFKFSLMRTRQDTNLWLTLLSQGYKSYGIRDSLVKYRVRKGQISGNKFKIAFRTFKVFMAVTSIPIYSRMYYFCFYAVNGIYKRIRN
ncbi:glycosyltransferase family 2 protein [Photobacterium phosphoreum]|uniref:glycosyltransferase family 2 protein n=1 Tax=Photobacterium phosphoreum TaxID=659 RepID=UPI001E41011D|nr:glycosyltransferase family 2 protein [Photobacterium phosphoreum]MCD9511864.1 glycosyltransferase [Photobacterium phosphoreum]